MDNQIAVIIPARGGSKGLPRKNVRPLGGKPLIAWSIDAALALEEIDSIFVSTDDEEIAAISRARGAEVPFMRPASLAADDAIIGDVVNHAIEHIDKTSGMRFGIYLCLYPTHPFRTRTMLAAAISALKSDTCCRFTTVRALAGRRARYAIIRDGMLTPAINLAGESPTLPYFRNYGLVQGMRIRADKHKTYLYPVMDPVSLIDIDTEQDLVLANEVVRKGLYDFDAG